MLKFWRFVAILGLLYVTAYPLFGDDGGIRIVNWPATSYGTLVTVQNFLVTQSATAGQTVASFTVPANVTFYLQYAEAEAYYSAFSTAVSNFGAAYLSANGIHGYTTQMAGAGLSRSGIILFDPPLTYSSGSVITWLVTPAATTSTVWYGNFGGYYR